MATSSPVVNICYSSSFMGVVLATLILSASQEDAQSQDTHALKRSAVIRVEADGSGDFTSIQAAIDAAAPGTTVRVGSGTFGQPVRIAKGITLEGSGWQKTAIVVKYDASKLDDPAVIAAFRQRESKTKTDEARAELWREFMVKYGPQPALSISDADNVVVCGMRFTLAGETPAQNTIQFGWAVGIRGSTVTLRDCAVAGSVAGGIIICDRANAEIQDCLVAGVWASGITVMRKSEDGTRARMIGCTVRTCHPDCISLQGVDKNTVIESCAISASPRFGIDLGVGSPVIRGNRLFDNAYGIAARNTNATIRGNLLVNNAVAGMRIFSGCRDTIEENSFVRSGRAGLDVVGRASPTVRRNIFLGNKMAIETRDLSGGDASERYEGPLTVEENFFWQNESIGFFGAEADRPKPGTLVDPKTEAARLAEAGNNRCEDPKFETRESNASDFTLSADSPARKAGAGNGPVPSAESPWPIQPAEVAMRAVLAAEENDDRREERAQLALRMAREWIENSIQRRDLALREQAFACIGQALSAPGQDEMIAGLVAVRRSSEERLNSERFLPRVLEMAKSGPAPVRLAAANALAALKADREARAVLMQLIHEAPGVLDNAGWKNWLRLNDGALTGEAADFVLARLQRRSSLQIHRFLVSLGNVKKLAPALEARMLELINGRNLETQRHVVCYILRGLDPKSPAVTRALIDLADHPDFGENRDAVEALTFGIRPEFRSLVADFFVRYLAEPEWRESRAPLAIRALKSLAGKKQVPDLTAILESPRTSEETRIRLRELLKHIDR